VELLKTEQLEEFVTKTQPALFQYLLKLTNEELKNEDRKIITEVLTALENISRDVYPDNTSEIYEKFTLALALKCFGCDSLEKRLAGLTDMKEMAMNITKKIEIVKKYGEQAKKTEYGRVWMSPE
jgi:hypothetical protein